MLFVEVYILLLLLKTQHLIEVRPVLVVHDLDFFALDQLPVNVVRVESPELAAELRVELRPPIVDRHEALFSDGEALSHGLALVNELESLVVHDVEATED